MSKAASSIVVAVCLLLFAAFALTPAEDVQTFPALINYQGKLVSSSGLPVSTGHYQLHFRVYAAAATNSNLIWGPQVSNGQSGPGIGSPEVVAAEVTMLISSRFSTRMLGRSQILPTSARTRPSLKAGSTSFWVSPARTIYLISQSLNPQVSIV